MKTYQKNGNTRNKIRAYCKEHFIEKYGREPNILDKVSLFSCSDFHHHCNHRNGIGYVCGGLLKLTDKFRQDNQGIEEWTCQICGAIINRR